MCCVVVAGERPQVVRLCHLPPYEWEWTAGEAVAQLVAVLGVWNSLELG